MKKETNIYSQSDYEVEFIKTKLLLLEFIQEQISNQATKNSPERVKAIAELFRSL